MSVVIEGVSFGPCPVTLPSTQVDRLMGKGSLLIDSNRNSGTNWGIDYNTDGSITLRQDGSYKVYRVGSTGVDGGRRSLRTAQYLCGVAGIVILYCAFTLDGTSSIANAKDFMINFASDILAVAAILVAAEFIDKWRGGSNANYARHIAMNTEDGRGLVTTVSAANGVHFGASSSSGRPFSPLSHIVPDDATASADEPNLFTRPFAAAGGI